MYDCLQTNGLVSESNKAFWDCLDDQAKAIILGYVPPTNHSTSARPPFTKSASSRLFTSKSVVTKSSNEIQAYLHEISAYDFLLANMHSLDSHTENEDSINGDHIEPPLSDEDNSETRLVNAAKLFGKPIPPGDIRRVMS
jgi:hypothetical protein